jgi:hypothetical protein
MFAVEGSLPPRNAPPELAQALDLHRFGGLARLTWTEYQATDQYVLDLLGVVQEAAAAVSRRGGA